MPAHWEGWGKGKNLEGVGQIRPRITPRQDGVKRRGVATSERASKEGLGEEFGRAIREAPRPAGRGAEHTISEGSSVVK